MPYKDGKGPQGQGSMTGRGFGPCRDGYGSGRGFGRGRGFGSGRGFRFWSKPISGEEEKNNLENYKKTLEQELDYIKSEQNKLEEEK